MLYPATGKGQGTGFDATEIAGMGGLAAWLNSIEVPWG